MSSLRRGQKTKGMAKYHTFVHISPNGQMFRLFFVCNFAHPVQGKCRQRGKGQKCMSRTSLGQLGSWGMVVPILTVDYRRKAFHSRLQDRPHQSTKSTLFQIILQLVTHILCTYNDMLPFAALGKLLTLSAAPLKAPFTFTRPPLASPRTLDFLTLPPSNLAMSLILPTFK